MASLPGRDLEVEPGGEHVLAEDRARAAGNREHERDARDRAVLHALRAGGADGREAARLEVEHRQTLGGAHQRLRARARGEAHLHSAGGVGGAEERLRPRRVVAVDEHRLGAVDRERLGVGDEPADRELEVPALLDRALRHHARATGLRADEQRDRVQRRVPRDADRRLELGEPPAAASAASAASSAGFSLRFVTRDHLAIHDDELGLRVGRRARSGER